MCALREQIVRAAQSECKVLILGENGVGKELVAEAIHQKSGRSQKHFVALNCAAVPETMLEAELFGHEKGAFTGAVARRAGVFERAHGGTIFLDEIGDMPLTMQAKLLRVLQSGTFERIGGHDTLQVDVRIVAATNKNLRQAVQEKAFREDLYHRIAVLPIRVPALRHRDSDIPELAKVFISRSTRPQMKFTDDALAELQHQWWPGNVRQLINIIDRLVVLARQDLIGIEDVRQALLLDEGDIESPTSTYLSRDVVAVPEAIAIASVEVESASIAAAPVESTSALPVESAFAETPPVESTASSEKKRKLTSEERGQAIKEGLARKRERALAEQTLTAKTIELKIGDWVRLGDSIAKIVGIDPAYEGLIGVELLSGGTDFWLGASVIQTSAPVAA